jgi:hypothetical protein
MASPRRSRGATDDSALQDNFVDHDTAGVLSHRATARQCFKGARVSSTSICIKTPAISKSELVRRPVGFDSETTAVRMSFGQITLHTDGFRLHVPPNHTPPAPKALASQYPIKLSPRFTSSATWVGLVWRDWINGMKSNSADRSSDLVPMLINLGSPLVA